MFVKAEVKTSKYLFPTDAVFLSHKHHHCAHGFVNSTFLTRNNIGHAMNIDKRIIQFFSEVETSCVVK